MFDPNDKRSVDRRARRQRLEAARASDDIRAVMTLPEGRRFIHGVLGLCGLRESAWRPGGLDAQRSQDFALGRQSIGLEILQQVEAHAHAEAEQMMAEARKAAAEKRQLEEAEDMAAETETIDG